MGIHFGGQENFARIVELTPAMRRQIEETIEHLLSILDAYDGDVDREEDDPAEEGGDDEPSLGWTEMQARWDRYGAGDLNYFLGCDCELDTADDEDGGDSEPSLGAPENRPFFVDNLIFGVRVPPGTYEPHREFRASQEHWADGRRGDHEREVENEHGVDWAI